MLVPRYLSVLPTWEALLDYIGVYGQGQYVEDLEMVVQ